MAEHGKESSDRRARAAEDIFTLVSILTLWPVILRWHHPAFQYALYAALVGLLAILVRRIRRFARTLPGRDG